MSGGVLKQTSNIYGDGSRELGERGTYALVKNQSFEGDIAYQTTCRTSDNDGLGLVWGWVDANNFSMAYWDGTTNNITFTKVVHGVATLVHSNPMSRVASRWYTITVVARDSIVALCVDGVVVSRTVDPAITAGRAGMFTVGCTGSEFSGFSVFR